MKHAHEPISIRIGDRDFFKVQFVDSCQQDIITKTKL